MSKRDTLDRVKSSLDLSITTQADGADAPSASLPNTRYAYRVRAFRNAGGRAPSNEATITTPAPTRYRTHITARRNPRRLRIVMQLLARLQHLNSL